MRSLFLCAALLLATPSAHAQAPEDSAEAPVAGVLGRVHQARALVVDLLRQYEWTEDGLEDVEFDDGEPVRLVPFETLVQWTTPVVQEADAAVAAAEWLAPDAADPYAVRDARSAIVAIHDNLAWDQFATRDALVDLAEAMAVLSGDLQQALATADEGAMDDDPSGGTNPLR